MRVREIERKIWIDKEREEGERKKERGKDKLKF